MTSHTNSSAPAPLNCWLTERLPPAVSKSVERLRHSDDVQQVAVLPDVHLAQEVCVGAVVATQRLVYPAAVGGDIGCGMAAVAVDAEAQLLSNDCAAAQLLAGLYEHVPANKHRQPVALPNSLAGLALSTARLQRQAEREGRVQLGTLGRGNHFLEFQADQQGQIWVMVHSGSRALGQVILARHLENAVRAKSGLSYLVAEDQAGQLYLADVAWARRYARENRLAMLVAVERLLQQLFRITVDWESLIDCDHNHVQQEQHGNATLWVHRKGAQSAREDEPGIIPGSMGTASFHTRGRGVGAALLSCSHGAGRRLNRSEARQRVSASDLVRQVGDVWYDRRRTAKLRDEAPAAYKDIRAVMRAQKDLLRIVRELRPLLSYKGV